MITKRKKLALVAVLLTCCLFQPALAQIKIPYETCKLPNGLTVILSVDKTTPTVAVNIWYHVGSKNGDQQCDHVADRAELAR